MSIQAVERGTLFADELLDLVSHLDVFTQEWPEAAQTTFRERRDEARAEFERSGDSRCLIALARGVESADRLYHLPSYQQAIEEEHGASTPGETYDVVELLNELRAQRVAAQA